MVTWYRLLSSRVNLSSPLKTLLARVAFDQGLFAPTFIAIFFTFNGLMDGCGMEEIQKRLQTGYPSALAGNYMIWPAGKQIFIIFCPTFEFQVCSSESSSISCK